MDQTAPDADAFHAIAMETVAAFPAPFAEMAREGVVQVAEFAPDDVLDEMETDPWALTGLYDGVSVMEKQSGYQPQGPDMVWLYRRAIIDEWAERGDVTLAQLVAHVTVHEFAHHFGWSDEDIAAIDRWWE